MIVVAVCRQHDSCVHRVGDGVDEHVHARKGQPLPPLPSKWKPWQWTARRRLQRERQA